MTRKHRPKGETCQSMILNLSGFLTINEIVERTGYDKSSVCKVINAGFYPYKFIKVDRTYEKLVALYPYLKGKSFPEDLLNTWLNGGDADGQTNP
jgi:hypothetical protein